MTTPAHRLQTPDGLHGVALAALWAILISSGTRCQAACWPEGTQCIFSCDQLIPTEAAGVPSASSSSDLRYAAPEDPPFLDQKSLCGQQCSQKGVGLYKEPPATQRSASKLFILTLSSPSPRLMGLRSWSPCISCLVLPQGPLFTRSEPLQSPPGDRVRGSLPPSKHTPHLPAGGAFGYLNRLDVQLRKRSVQFNSIHMKVQKRQNWQNWLGMLTQEGNM